MGEGEGLDGVGEMGMDGADLVQEEGFFGGGDEVWDVGCCGREGGDGCGLEAAWWGDCAGFGCLCSGCVWHLWLVLGVCGLVMGRSTWRTSFLWVRLLTVCPRPFALKCTAEGFYGVGSSFLGLRSKM